MKTKNSIIIKNGYENNLRNINLEIPHDKFVVVTGVSGAGKTSLLFDLILKESEYLFLQTIPTYTGRFSGKLEHAKVESISGLRSCVAVNQRTITPNIRSTVGTITQIYDYLRLLFSRCGDYSGNEKLTRANFSFNSEKGWCPVCKGLGVEEKIAPELLISDEEKSLREGALVPTTPSGYIVYSQVTMDVLDTVCKAHGFSVDIPWYKLSEDEKNVIFYGTDRVKIPFGKHTLESRLKWKGIKAKPRQEGYYRGIVTIMNEILKRDRNKNILRFVKQEKCSECDGKRLNKKALNVLFDGKTIAQFSEMTISQLREYFGEMGKENAVAYEIGKEIAKRASIFERMGLSYLTLSRAGETLSSGELRRISIGMQAISELEGILYLFDEPSSGLHPYEINKLISVLKEIKSGGNSLLVITHNGEIVKNSEYAIELGPKAGINGGEIIFQGDAKRFNFPCFSFENKKKSRKNGLGEIVIKGASANNLKNIDVVFKKGALNVITGLSGAGKSSLLKEVLYRGLKNDFSTVSEISGISDIKNVFYVNRKPIGKTSRSNPATYIKLYDEIRKLFGKSELAKKKGFTNKSFSFNTPGGRCEKCKGMGVVKTGMLFLGDAEVVCDECGGKRFKDEILDVTIDGKNIYDVLELSFSEAYTFFYKHKKIRKIVETVIKQGLGYLKLGQPSSTLSGGEAQRIKLVTALANSKKGESIYLFDEPSKGLHPNDIEIIIKVLEEIIKRGDTVVLVTHDPFLIEKADFIVDLGPLSGEKGGKVIFSGTFEELLKNKVSFTAKALRGEIERFFYEPKKKAKNEISLFGVNTNNLKNLDVKFPKNKFSVVLGASGAGKSSLIFGSLYPEAEKRFLSKLSNYARSYVKEAILGEVRSVEGITPTFAVRENRMSGNPYSTVGTMSGIYELLRLFFSRYFLIKEGKTLFAEAFSFNNPKYACPECNGIGSVKRIDLDKLIVDREKSPFDGAFLKMQALSYYTEKKGRYFAVLKSVGESLNINFLKPLKEFTEKERNILFYGTGERIFSVKWEYDRKGRKGEHVFESKWEGFVTLFENEYKQLAANGKGKKLDKVLKEESCPICNGKRLRKESLSYKIKGKSIADLTILDLTELIEFIDSIELPEELYPLKKEILRRISMLMEAGLVYLSLNRITHTLSHGEYKRLNIAMRIGGFKDVTYLFDEPFSGLHWVERKKILSLLNILKKDNTVIVIEHDTEIAKKSDYIIDFGLKSGEEGGEIVAVGNYEHCKTVEGSTLNSFSDYINAPLTEKKGDFEQALSFKKAFGNNLKNITSFFPKNSFSVITGVSGAGKTTLLFDVLATSYEKGISVNCENFLWVSEFKKVIKNEGKLPSGSGLSTVATYLNILDEIKKIFADTALAKSKKYGKEYFSYAGKGGCKKCGGLGYNKVAMDFMADIKVVCDECFGKRYMKEVLSVKYNGKTIADIMEMSISDAGKFFNFNKKIVNIVKLSDEIGLSYLKLGQSIFELSTGEKKRIKFVKDIFEVKKNALFLLDEPTDGLHVKDRIMVYSVIRKLVNNGNSVIATTHDPYLIRDADYVIDLGKEGGKNGGEIIFEGTPFLLSKCEKSYTGEMLKELFT